MQEARKYCYVEVRDRERVIAKLPVYFYRRVWDFDRDISHRLYFIKLTYVRVDTSAVKYVSAKRYSFRFINTARSDVKASNRCYAAVAHSLDPELPGVLGSLDFVCFGYIGRRMGLPIETRRRYLGAYQKWLKEYKKWLAEIAAEESWEWL